MRAATLILVLSGALAATGCAHKGAKKNPQVFGEATNMNKEAADITKNKELEKRPGKFVGKDIKLRGDVKEVVNNRAFVMPIDNFMGQNEILVVNETGFRVPLRKNDYVEVMGPLRMFTVSEVAEVVDKDLVDELYVNYGNQPIIVAEVVKGYWAENRPTQRTRGTRDARDRTKSDEDEYSH